MDSQKYGCSAPATAPADAEEEKRQAANCLKCFYAKVWMFVLPLGILAAISGIVTLALAGYKHQWPFLTVFPLINGCLLIGAGACAMMAGKQNLDNGVTRTFMNYSGAVHGLMISVLSQASLASTFSGQAVGRCATDHEDCSPNHDAQLAFHIINIVLAVLAYPLACGVMGIHCKHGRKLYGKNCC